MITRCSKKKLSANEVISSTDGGASRNGRKASRSEAIASRMMSTQMAATMSGAGQAPINMVAVTALDGTISA